MTAPKPADNPLDAAINDFTQAAEKEGFYTGAGMDAPPAAAAGPAAAQPPAAPQVVVQEWQPNPKRIERLKGPCGRTWGMTWNQIAARNGVPELQVGQEQRDEAGQQLAELLDAVLPPEVVSGPKSRGETVLYALVGLGLAASGNLQSIAEAAAEKEAAKEKGGTDGT